MDNAIGPTPVGTIMGLIGIALMIRFFVMWYKAGAGDFWSFANDPTKRKVMRRVSIEMLIFIALGFGLAIGGLL